MFECLDFGMFECLCPPTAGLTVSHKKYSSNFQAKYNGSNYIENKFHSFFQPTKFKHKTIDIVVRSEYLWAGIHKFILIFQGELFYLIHIGDIYTIFLAKYYKAR
jgi:hypothetical protein